jgi:altronate dehydratase large subunit
MKIPTDGFAGYLRPDGRVGIRNNLLILSVTGLTGPTARRIAQCIHGAVYVGTPSGSGLIGDDQQIHDRAVTGFGLNPNSAAVLVIGADPPRVDAIAAAIAQSGKPVEKLTLDECGHDAITLTERGLRLAAKLTREISRYRRETVPLSGLFIGLECGRSDPSSGLVANPLLGRIADRLVDAGGAAVFGETMEWLGLDESLAQRAADPVTGTAIRAAVLNREQLAVGNGIDLLGKNPGPTYIVAGLSTIEEKAIGNVAKSGSRPVRSLLQYAEAPATPGLHAMDAAAYAPESLSGFSAAGTQLILFTTGVGNSFVNAIAPTIKVSANPQTCARLDSQLDFKCAEVFNGYEPVETAAARLFECVLDIAGGTLTYGEILGEGEDVISRYGPGL